MPRKILKWLLRSTSTFINLCKIASRYYLKFFIWKLIKTKIWDTNFILIFLSFLLVNADIRTLGGPPPFQMNSPPGLCPFSSGLMLQFPPRWGPFSLHAGALPHMFLFGGWGGLIFPPLSSLCYMPTASLYHFQALVSLAHCAFLSLVCLQFLWSVSIWHLSLLIFFSTGPVMALILRLALLSFLGHWDAGFQFITSLPSSKLLCLHRLWR